MDKSVQITLIIVIGAIVLASLGFIAFSSVMPAQNTVTGNGQATIDATPDLVKVYFNVDTKAKTSQEARDQNAEIVEDLRVALLMENFGTVNAPPNANTMLAGRIPRYFDGVALNKYVMSLVGVIFRILFMIFFFLILKTG